MVTNAACFVVANAAYVISKKKGSPCISVYQHDRYGRPFTNHYKCMNIKEQQLKALQNARGFISHEILDESDLENYLDSIGEDGFILLPKSLMAQVIKVDKLRMNIPRSAHKQLSQEEPILATMLDEWMEANCINDWTDLEEKEVNP